MSEKAQTVMNLREQQPAKRGFVSRGVLISELSDNALHEQNLAGAVIKEAVMSLVSALKAKNAYEELVLRKASEIMLARASRKRRESETVLIRPGPRKASEKPADDAHALRLALEGMGLRTEVKERKPTPSGMYFAFTVEVDGEACRLMLPANIMEGEDPVSAAKEIARKFGIMTREEGKMVADAKREAEKAVMLERRRESRPAPVPLEELGLDASMLAKRKITFDGTDALGKNHFSYLDECGGSFCVDSAHKGKPLLGKIDGRIIAFHAERHVPGRMDPSVLEECSSTYASLPAFEAIGQGGIKAIAKSLDLLAMDKRPGISRIVPPEYAEALDAISKSEAYSRWKAIRAEGALEQDETEMLAKALSIMSHPALGIVTAVEEHCASGNGAGVEAGDIGTIMDATIGFHSSIVPGMSAHALSALAQAYSMVVREDAESWDEETLRLNHLRMILTVRKAASAFQKALSVAE
ncbi:MAG: hypothetical protein AB1324_04940 [Candidatus Micrarchaeota archaeon]